MTSKPTRMKGVGHDDPRDGANKGRTGVHEPELTRRSFSGQQPQMVLTLDKGGEGNLSGYWVWDEDGNRFIKVHIPVEKLPHYKCSYCQMSFRGSGALSEHLKGHNMEGDTILTKVGSLSGVDELPPAKAKPVPLVDKSNSHDVSISKSLSLMSLSSASVEDVTESHDISKITEEAQTAEDDFKLVGTRGVASREKGVIFPPGSPNGRAVMLVVQTGTNGSPGPVNETSGNGEPQNDKLERLPKRASTIFLESAKPFVPYRSDHDVNPKCLKPDINVSSSFGGPTALPKPRSPATITQAGTKSPDLKFQQFNHDYDEDDPSNAVKNGRGIASFSQPVAAEEPQTGKGNLRKAIVPAFPGKTDYKLGQSSRIPSSPDAGNGQRGSTPSGSPVENSGIEENMEVIQSNGKGEQKTRCKLCDKTFSSRQSTMRHIKAVHLKEKPFQCHICSRGFFEKRNLQLHLNYHGGIKPYKCHICPARFIQKGHLTVHLHKHNGIKPYKCDKCGISYSQRYHLTQHQRIHKEMIQGTKVENN